MLGANALVLALFKAATVSDNDKQQAKETDRMALFWYCNECSVCGCNSMTRGEKMEDVMGRSVDCRKKVDGKKKHSEDLRVTCSLQRLSEWDMDPNRVRDFTPLATPITSRSEQHFYPRRQLGRTFSIHSTCTRVLGVRRVLPILRSTVPE